MRTLTGIQPSGTLHIGNYFGAMRPAIEAQARGECFYFIADYHSMTALTDAQQRREFTLGIALDWLACGLDPAKAVFWRQSDIPEVCELTWMIGSLTPMGLLERAHSYKDKTAKGISPNFGLFAYPVLMAADILMFNAHRVPVGRDQVQHIEMARDIATRFNHLYGQGRELFVLPQAQVDEAVATLPGLDGRKMSKSYDNTLPLFEGGARQLRETVARIVTDSRLPGEPKNTEGSALVMIHDAVATVEQRAAFHADLQAGLGWGEAKARTTAVLEAHLAPMRERYEALVARPDELEDILLQGARKARALATPFLQSLREAVGLGRLAGSGSVAAPKAAPTAPDKLPSFKQYRETDGRFYFKLAAHDGAVLLQSQGFESGRDAGQWVKRIRTEGMAAAQAAPVGLGPGVAWPQVQAALQVLQTHDAQTAAAAAQA